MCFLAVLRAAQHCDRLFCKACFDAVHSKPQAMPWQQRNAIVGGRAQRARGPLERDHPHSHKDDFLGGAKAKLLDLRPVAPPRIAFQLSVELPDAYAAETGGDDAIRLEELSEATGQATCQAHPETDVADGIKT